MTERTPTHEKTVKQLWDGETIAMPNCKVKNKRGYSTVCVFASRSYSQIDELSVGIHVLIGS